MEKKYQIFISSTYKDLKTARKRVSETILSMGHFPVGMEMFGASDDEQWKVIQRTIDLSDYYIVIVGKCFGSQVPREEISYTQKEFRYAKEKNIPILAFLIDINAKIPKTFQDTEEDKIIKLNAFRQELENGRTVDYWANYDNLATKVAISLQKVFASHPMSGWIKECNDEEKKDSSLKAPKKEKNSSEELARKIEDKTKKELTKYQSTEMEGKVVFRFDNNNGVYTLGEGKYAFTTKWSQCGNNSIYAYGKIGYLPDATEMPDWDSISKFDFSSQHRTIRTGQIVIYMNAQSQFAAIKMGSVKSSGHGNPYDEMEFEYKIYTDNTEKDNKKTYVNDEEYEKECSREYRTLKTMADQMLYRHAALYTSPIETYGQEQKKASEDFNGLGEKFHVFANKTKDMDIGIPETSKLIEVSRYFTGLSHGLVLHKGEDIFRRIEVNTKYEEKIKDILGLL